jgi:hypothetical protein
MILLDENIAEDQAQLLRSWRIRVRQIGHDVGPQGLKDEQQILPLLRKLARPTLITRDLGFCHPRWCHEKYALVCLAVSQNEVARFTRRFLRHPAFNTKAKRMGAVVRVTPTELRVWRLNKDKEQRIAWP